MEKILVLGSTGMLGHTVFKVLSKEKSFEVHGTQGEDSNAPYYFNVEDGIKEDFNNYDYLINCIGILSNAIDACDSSSVARAIKINALFPHELAREIKSKIIHMSTDGVFSGKGGPYDEDAPHDCLDIYGKTKSLGEVIADNVLNIRTSILGPSPLRKQGLQEWFLSQPEGATINGYANHIWNGVTTLQFAELCAKIIKENAFHKLRKESFVFHFAPNQPVTKYELLNLFKRVFEKNITVNPVESSTSVKRILTTKYDGIKNLYKHNQSMEENINKLKQYI